MALNNRITIHDIARYVGVGVGTVSRVLNEHPNVSANTRAAVQHAIEQLGYRPRSAAKVLRTRKSLAIGFITDYIATSPFNTTPFTGSVISGAQDVAWQYGRILLLVNTNGDPVLEDAAVEMMLSREVEGIIYATAWHRMVAPPKNACETNVVLLDCFVEDRSLPSVVPDELRGGYEATERLIQNGHHRIGLINHSMPDPAQVLRAAGYRCALADHGSAYDDTLVVQRFSEPSGGYEAMYHLLRLPDPPSAVFCYNDRMAMGAYDAIKEQGLRIPQDMAVIGYDNQELVAANLHPALTTMELPHYGMGRWAAQYLLNGESRPASPPQVKLACPLIERKSV